MPDVLSAHAATRPDKVALVLGERAVDYEEYNRRACRAGNAFSALGVGVGDRVAVQAHNSLEGFEIAGGLRKLGAIAVPVNFRLRGSELAFILEDSRPLVVCAGPGFLEHVQAVLAGLEGPPAAVALGAPPPEGWLDYERLLATAPIDEPESDIGTGLGASMIYTSGTTGHPKGAYRPLGLPLERVVEGVQLFEIGPDDVHLFAAPGYHSAPGYFNGLTLAVGGTIVVMPHFDPEEALALIERHRCTTTFMAPTLLHRIMDLPEATRGRYDVSSLRKLILGGAPCPHSLKVRAIEYLGEVLWEFYGATETGVNLVLRPEEQLSRPGAAGRPAPGHEIVLLDPEGREVPDGEPGELWVRNPVLATYYKKPGATERATREGGYFSVGDIAYRDADGYYHLCDRKVDMIISGGVNIYPAEIEACLHAHPAVRDVAVIGVPDEEWGESVKAVVALREGAAADESELVGWCRARIADYKRPRSVDFVDDLPRDLAGKLLKRQIRAPYWTAAGRRI